MTILVNADDEAIKGLLVDAAQHAAADCVSGLSRGAF
jgi:peptidyl-tRNA hydrolase